MGKNLYISADIAFLSLQIIGNAGGKAEDKFIPWGATIPDKYGNYYYTSFPQLGFVIPYIFFSQLNIKSTLHNLMIFNFGIHFICSILIFILIQILTKKWNAKRYWIASLGTLIYIINYEALYSHGVIYWGQSLFQVFWIAQLISLALLIERKHFKYKKIFLGLFVLFSFLAPATEWTGYLSNFAILLVLLLQKRNKKEPFILIAATLMALIFFIGSFYLNVDSATFWQTLKSRFFARNFTSDVSYLELFKGYFNSFGPYLVTLSLFGGYIIFKKETRGEMLDSLHEFRVWIFICGFPMIENIIMKQHAIRYTFDRLKLVLLIILVICVLFKALTVKGRKLLTLAIAVSMIISIMQFTKSERVWEIPEMKNNEIIRNDLRGITNALYATPYTVRGYVNLSFEHGIYEHVDDRTLIEKTNISDYEKGVWLLGNDLGNQIYVWKNVVIFNKKFKKFLIKGIATAEEIQSNRILVNPLILPYLKIGNIQKKIYFKDKIGKILSFNSDGWVNIQTSEPLSNNTQLYSIIIN